MRRLSEQLIRRENRNEREMRDGHVTETKLKEIFMINHKLTFLIIALMLIALGLFLKFKRSISKKVIRWAGQLHMAGQPLCTTGLSSFRGSGCQYMD
jgi:hypothetical protein